MSSSAPGFVTPGFRAHRLYYPRSSSTPRRPVQATVTSGPTHEISTSEVSIPTSDNSTISAYLATPNLTPAPKAGVVLLSDINGFETPDTRKVADLLASHALPTIVPDLFRGNPWPCQPPDDTYETWRQSHPEERVHADIASAVSAMRQRGFAHPLGLIGFCFGGGRLMHEISLAESGINPTAVAAFYPTRFDPVACGTKAKSPLFFVTGDQDPLVPESVYETLRETLETKNEVMEDCEMIIVEGAGHAFAHRPKTDTDIVDSANLLEQAAQWLVKFLAE